MTRALGHAAFLWSSTVRLTMACRALRPRLSGRGDRLRAMGVVLALWLRAATRLDVPVPRLRLVIGGARRTIRVGDESEFFGSYEVFSSGDYDIECGRVLRVLDLGANVGFASMLLSERYPEAEIVAVEAAPDTFARLKANVANLRQVRPLHLAVGVDGAVRIDLGLPSAERHASETGALVRGLSLTRLLIALGWDHVDLMKIDVEGAESAVFADPAMGLVAVVVGEVHGDGDPVAMLRNYEVESRPAVGGSATMIRARLRCRPVAEPGS